ncbi:AMP-binding protein [Frankia sp. CiP1_Cm_nod2]|uniref:AMP-binding protein n=1 Tax=Frankia sp. CiP1_Cm_nod2 TaxID=2897161 RepID=UPI00202545E2
MNTLLSALYAGAAELRTDSGRLASDDLAAAVGAVAARVAGARTVAVATTDPQATMIAVAGAIAAGAAAVPISQGTATEERRHILADSAPDLVLDEVEPGAHAPLPAPLPADESPGLILYTSGSTGRPKGVVLSRRAIAFGLDALSGVWDWTADDALVHALPLTHVHGLVFGVLGPLRLGSPLVYTGPMLRPVLGGTIYFGVPTTWGSLADAAVEELSGARLLVSGAAPLPRATFTRIARISGHLILDRYAMTETLVIASPSPSDPDRAPGSLGRPLPGVEIVLRDAGMPEETGEVLVRGDSLFSGYLGRPSTLLPDGWFPTGDLGRLGDDGTLSLAGRCATDIIKTAGYRVGAGEVEDALLSHPAVTEAAVVGLPDDWLGERVTAWVVLSEEVSAETLNEHLSERLSPFKRPRAIHMTTALPRNQLGKLQKNLLKEG